MIEQESWDLNNRHGQQVIQIDAGKGIAIVAVVMSLFAAGGVIVGAIMIPSLIESKAQALAAPASVRSQIAEREARLAQEDLKMIRAALERNKIHVDKE